MDAPVVARWLATALLEWQERAPQSEVGGYLRVLFDGFWFHHGPPSQRHVLREMTKTWAELFPKDSLALLVRKKHHDVASLDEPGLVAEYFQTSLYPHALAVTAGAYGAIRKFTPDVVLNHNFSVPTTALSATYVHDFLFLDHPEWFTAAERMYFQGMPATARWSDVVYTSTETEAGRIRRHIPRSQVVPVGLGLSSELLDATEDPQVISNLGVTTGRFALTVGRLNSRKNLVTSLEAYLSSSLPQQGIPMIVVGESNGKNAMLNKRIEDAIAGGMIRMAGHVSDAELKALYQRAAVFVFLSLGEGYGMPPVEAAYFGCPQILSDLPVFRENLGDAATYVDPLNISEVSKALDVLTMADSSNVETSAVAWLQRHNWDSAVRKIRDDLVQRLVVRSSSISSEG